jgi:hypothetical protein
MSFLGVFTYQHNSTSPVLHGTVTDKGSWFDHRSSLRMTELSVKMPNPAKTAFIDDDDYFLNPDVAAENLIGTAFEEVVVFNNEEGSCVFSKNDQQVRAIIHLAQHNLQPFLQSLRCALPTTQEKEIHAFNLARSYVTKSLETNSQSWAEHIAEGSTSLEPFQKEDERLIRINFALKLVTPMISGQIGKLFVPHS